MGLFSLCFGAEYSGSAARRRRGAFSGSFPIGGTPSWGSPTPSARAEGANRRRGARAGAGLLQTSACHLLENSPAYWSPHRRREGRTDSAAGASPAAHLLEIPTPTIGDSGTRARPIATSAHQLLEIRGAAAAALGELSPPPV